MTTERAKAFEDMKRSLRSAKRLTARSWMTRHTGSDASFRPMHRFSPIQREKLLNLFAANRYPSTEVKRNLAEEFNVSIHRISCWFNEKRRARNNMESCGSSGGEDFSRQLLSKRQYERLSTLFEKKKYISATEQAELCSELGLTESQHFSSKLHVALRMLLLLIYLRQWHFYRFLFLSKSLFICGEAVQDKQPFVCCLTFDVELFVVAVIIFTIQFMFDVENILYPTAVVLSISFHKFQIADFPFQITNWFVHRRHRLRKSALGVGAKLGERELFSKFSPIQLTEFLHFFNKPVAPSKEELTKVASELDVPIRKVINWFNRRANVPKIEVDFYDIEPGLVYDQSPAQSNTASGGGRVTARCQEIPVGNEITERQLEMLEIMFEDTDEVAPEMVTLLSKASGLTQDEIVGWFRKKYTEKLMDSSVQAQELKAKTQFDSGSALKRGTRVKKFRHDPMFIYYG
ncbi:putative homeobox domain protein [Trichinella spiralis]|uniref:putative homeobox domain protein n=1 Tax=Trichinella spiralis TaxID=6334 RepID=UPI0001EFB6BA|nr:putative homeobox domain protein [Trichinella spiralis]